MWKHHLSISGERNERGTVVLRAEEGERERVPDPGRLTGHYGSGSPWDPTSWETGGSSEGFEDKDGGDRGRLGRGSLEEDFPV